MRDEYHFMPATVLNIGVGRCPEYQIWKELLPNARLIGIDARGKRDAWGGEYIQAALGARNEVVNYCGRCRHTKCTDPQHRRKWHALQAQTLDGVATDLQGPLFIWMDIDGAELDVIAGGDWTFRRAMFVNCEVRNFAFAPDHAHRLQARMATIGHRFIHWHEGTFDALFTRVVKESPVVNSTFDAHRPQLQGTLG